MSRTSLALLGLPLLGLLATTVAANAQDHPLRGHWEFRAPTAAPDYRGVMLVDAAGRATYDSPMDAGRPARFVGYVERSNGSYVQILLTNRANVIRANCMVQSNDLLECQFFRDSGKVSNPFSLVRTGAGPASLQGPPPPSR
jgi:hypothetical protein